MTEANRYGRQLRKVRELYGFSRETVARRLGLSRTDLTDMENGNRRVSVLELTGLAEIYGCSPSFFLEENEELRAEDIMVVLHGALPEKMNGLEHRYSVRHIADLCREGEVLRRILGLGACSQPPCYAAETESAGIAVQQGGRVAHEERCRLRLGDAAVCGIAELLADQGIWTAAADLPENMSGLLVHSESTGFAVLVNAGRCTERQRFSCAHEYAHVLFDRGPTVRTTLRENSSELAEMRANAFASAFLMPSGGVERWLNGIGKGYPGRLARTVFSAADGSATEIRARSGSQVFTCQDAGVLARRFGVSYAAAVWRLKNLRHISSAEAHVLLGRKKTAERCVEFSDRCGQFERPGQGFHNQLAWLAAEAFRRGKISQGRLLEIGKKLEVGGERLLETAHAASAESHQREHLFSSNMNTQSR